MDKLYDLTIYSFPNDSDRDWSSIGLFTSFGEALRTAEEYLNDVPGFCDYYCEPEIIAVPVIGSEDPREVWRFIGWNADKNGGETDIIESDCYVSQQLAHTNLEQIQKTMPRQEWTLNRWIIGERHWQDGFIREYPDGRKAPTLREIRTVLKEAMDSRKLVKIEFHYADYDRFFFPLAVGEKLFLCAEENDFLLDGFTVRRIRDVEHIEPREGMYSEIMQYEGWLDNLKTPNVDISDWHGLFRSLEQLGQNIIVEEEHLDDDSCFAIGAIAAVGQDHILLHRFDSEGIWDDQPIKIAYDDITSVSFGTRYINIFSKYLTPRN